MQLIHYKLTLNGQQLNPSARESIGKTQKKNQESGGCLPKGVFIFLTPRANDIGMVCPVILLPLPHCQGNEQLEAR
jgi:hypothetical protein